MSRIVGFSPEDANLLLGLIEASGGQQILHRDPRRRPTIKWGQTTEAGIAANSVNPVHMQAPTPTGWANAVQIEAWNRGSAIAPNTLSLLIPIDGRWCVFEVCP